VGVETAPDQLIATAELLELARSLAQAAGEVLRDRPAHLQVSTKSSPTDVVTEMDKGAERVILDGLRRARPQDAVVSEESAATAGDSGVRWLIDPLDGTVNYLYGIPHYAVSIAAEVDGQPEVAVVLDVERRIEYVATRGGGATRDGRTIQCSMQTDAGQALVATGFNYGVELRRTQARELVTILPAVRDIRRAGSAALDLCAVASGQVDAFFEAGMYPWDWAAGALIAQEAGARVDGLQGQQPGRNTTLAANPDLFHVLHDVVVAAIATGASLER
jgi:myo-inositol-1(or 4)-monophosphatase